LKDGARARDLQRLQPGPIDHRLVHEGDVVVAVHAPQREREQRPRRIQRFDHQFAATHHDRQAFGPDDCDVGQHHRLAKLPATEVPP
jgi:hypothetical protein